ncbi:MAG: PQQ-binding-like beta-propeller repeat protein [Planctomycetes bacterium]|nr:PQQ-binding-like beta-propeller repeat protein [Planctomycetota bacterium]
MPRIRRLGQLTLGAYLMLSVGQAGAQWLQFAGPTRDFRVQAKKPLKDWGAKGPKIVWQHDLGEGYSSILCDAGRLYTMYHKDGQEIVICLNAADGKTVWEHKYPVPDAEKGAGGFGPGPRSTPVIVGDRIFAAGITGVLQCLSKDDGAVIWVHRLLDEFGGNLPQWGYAPSPLAWEDLLIAPAGGQGKAVVAFQQTDGKVVWTAGANQNGYSSPIVIDFEHKPQVVVLMSSAVLGMNPRTGEELWSFEHKTMYDVNAALPVIGPDNTLLISSAYATGSRALKLSRKGEKIDATELWSNTRNGVHHGAIARIGDSYYGSVGMIGPAFFTKLDAKTGEQKWKDRSFRKATFLVVGEQLLVIDEGGKLAVATIGAEGMNILCEEPLLSEPAWTVPTLVDGRAYLRDRKVIMAIELASE